MTNAWWRKWKLTKRKEIRKRGRKEVIQQTLWDDKIVISRTPSVKYVYEMKEDECKMKIIKIFLIFSSFFFLHSLRPFYERKELNAMYEFYFLFLFFANVKCEI